ncbi:beta-1,4-xylosyltransferase IRX14 [Rhodamnia argentea]|uniref:Glycosyltransferases n=1 Tax=Rhodamnia argentea TaxID=178133 RepID=A0A8B8PX70_9MYRT|nr:beta-1,4-xylosyltransferase IRX14 [Rhodamnia argentea]
MKFLAMPQSHADGQSGALRGLSPADSSKSPAATIFWLAVHAVCCLGSLVLGFRFSRLFVFLLYSTSPMLRATDKTTTYDPIVLLSDPSQSPVNQSTPHVAVGRHGIQVRPWPHPEPVEVMKAHQIIERVQREQRAQFTAKNPNPRSLIVITPTYVRAFQAMHLTALMHSLMLVPYKVVWIVVEAGGVTSETALLIKRSGLRTVHVGFKQEMPEAWEDRHSLEAKMRVHALRIVRDKNLDGIVMFADDSNIHSMELFDEVQAVKWIGAVSLGILPHSTVDESDQAVSKVMDESNSLIPIQGPVCDSANQFKGWRTDNGSPNMLGGATHVDDRGSPLPGKLEWAGFALNSRMLWKHAEGKPGWVRDLDSPNWDNDVDSPMSLLKDISALEPLGNCSRRLMVWRLRVEARPGTEFPKGWLIDPPLGIPAPSKRTPWPDAFPKLPFTENASSDEEEINQHPTENRRHETETAKPQLLRREPVEN